MSSPLKFVPALTALGLSVLMPGAAHAQTTVTAGNLIANGGFETGYFNPGSDWLKQGKGVQVGTSDPHTGTYAADFTGSGNISEGVITALPTTVGQTYTLDFFLDASANTTGAFYYTLGDNGLTTTAPVVYLAGAGYQEYKASYLAATSNGYVQFTDNPGGTGRFSLDDVSLTPAGAAGPASAAPEPPALAGLLFAALGVGGLALSARRGRKSAA